MKDLRSALSVLSGRVLPSSVDLEDLGLSRYDYPSESRVREKCEEIVFNHITGKSKSSDIPKISPEDLLDKYRGSPENPEDFMNYNYPDGVLVTS